jgi:sporulation protein YqfC
MKPRRYKKPQKEKLSNRLASNVVDSLQMPKDLAFGAVVATITGQNEAYIENYRGILEYTETKIKLQTKTCKLELLGTRLNIEYYTNDEMKVTGCITQINYMI